MKVLCFAYSELRSVVSKPLKTDIEQSLTETQNFGPVFGVRLTKSRRIPFYLGADQFPESVHTDEGVAGCILYLKTIVFQCCPKNIQFP